MNSIFTVNEAADILKVSPITIRRWLRKGALTGSQTPAGWRVQQSDIDTFINAHRPHRSVMSVETPPAYQKEQAP